MKRILKDGKGEGIEDGELVGIGRVGGENELKVIGNWVLELEKMKESREGGNELKKLEKERKVIVKGVEELRLKEDNKEEIRWEKEKERLLKIGDDRESKVEEGRIGIDNGESKLNWNYEKLFDEWRKVRIYKVDELKWKEEKERKRERFLVKKEFWEKRW